MATPLFRKYNEDPKTLPMKRMHSSIESSTSKYFQSAKRLRQSSDSHYTDNIMITLKDTPSRNNRDKIHVNNESLQGTSQDNKELNELLNKDSAVHFDSNRVICTPKVQYKAVNTQAIDLIQANKELMSIEEKITYHRELREQIQKLTIELKKKKELRPKVERDKEIEILKQNIEQEKQRYRQQRESTEGLTDSISILERQLETYEDQRKQIHNYIQQLKGNIRVFCRIKPIHSSNIVSCSELNGSISVQSTVISIGQSSIYMFDRVFTSESTQEEVFNEVSQFLQSALDGEKVCVFAYGQTGSGKTYTMEGPAEDELYDGNKPTIKSGILPRAGDYIFKEISRLNNKGYEYVVMCSALEIHNEELQDLLQTDKDEGVPQLMVSMERNETEIKPLNWVTVLNTIQLMDAIKTASKNRRVQKTASNERSSRSHFIFHIKLTFTSSAGKNGTGMLSIIDLAGSERPTKDPVISKNASLMKEAKSINQSLTTLGRVLTMLASRKVTKKTAIPYRESKLTRVLQNSLQFESKTLMFVNISSAIEDLSQTKESLRFASTAAFVC